MIQTVEGYRAKGKVDQSNGHSPAVYTEKAGQDSIAAYLHESGTYNNHDVGIY
jgi:hypothetical protein